MRRITYIAGRMGTSLLVVGFAFFLIYLIPTASFGGIETVEPSISPQKFDAPTNDFFSPTRGAQYEVRGNGSFRFLVFDVDPQQIYNWTNMWARGMGGAPLGPLGYYEGYDNYTALTAYLAQYPAQAVIDQNSTANQLVKADYTPSNVTSLVVVIGNPASDLLFVNITTSSNSSIAPKAATLLISELLIPTGVILAAPWIFGVYANKRRNQLNYRNQKRA